MYTTDECAFLYRKLLQLMEEDSDSIAHALQGELLDAYRELLEKEKSILNDSLRKIQTIY